MKAQRVARSLAQHTSTSSSILFCSTTTSPAARHRAWQTACSLRHAHRKLSTSHPRLAISKARLEAEAVAAEAAKATEPTSEPSQQEPPPDRRSEPILPPTPSAAPVWGAPQKLKRRTISPQNAQIAALISSTTRSDSGGSGGSGGRAGISNRIPPRTASKPGARPYDSFRETDTPTAKRQNDLANILGDVNKGEWERIDAPPPVRMDAFMGRAAIVNRTTQPLARALGVLNSTLRANQIKEQLRKQRFHERPGLRRKRLKSERWRKRFMVGFRHMVSKVREMKAQGW